MDDEIRVADTARTRPEAAAVRRFVPMQIGAATVYVEQVGEPAIEADDRIRPVGLPSPQEAFEKAGEILHECVRIIGERIEIIAEKATPQKVTVEFSITFEAKGKTSLIPVFVTGESGVQTGLKITAVWQRPQTGDR